MTYFKLGDGKYSVAQSTLANKVPALTIRRLDRPVEVGSILDPSSSLVTDLDLVVEIATPQAAAVLLTVAQAIAFAHGLQP